MKAEGKFIFKSIKAREGGEFTNQQGQKIQYQPSFQVKFDEYLDGEAKERSIKVSQEQVELISKLKAFKPYSQVELVFDVGFNATGCFIKLLDVNQLKETKDN